MDWYLSVIDDRIFISTKKEGKSMNLDEFKAHVKTQREASKAEALSVLSAKIILKKEGNN
jgi:hypothetical protein